MHGTLASLQTAYMPEEQMHVGGKHEKNAWLQLEL
jgi:hypothetical protein